MSTQAADEDTPLSDDDVRRVVSLISLERFATFMRIAGTERDALDLYHQTMRTAGALMPVIGVFEVALRNAIAEQLRSSFGRPGWLMAPPAPFKWKGDESSAIRQALGHAQKAAYAKKSNTEKKALDAGLPPTLSHEQRSKQRQRAIVVTIGDHIAQLTLFFWKRLFSADYEATLWKPSLRRLFPNKAITRAQVAEHLEAIHVARNRLAHHEPVLGSRLEGALEAIDFLATNFGERVPTQDSILAKLLQPYREVLDRETFALGTMLGRFDVTAHIQATQVQEPEST